MISKELLSEVLQKEAEIGGKSILGESYIEYKIVLPSGGKLIRDVNIYELAHKCKAWAFKNGVSVYCIQYKVDFGEYCLYLYDIEKEADILNTRTDVMSFATEPTALFKACQWILENKI